MKSKLLLLALFCISLQINAQPPCPFIYNVSPGTNSVSFFTDSNYTGGQYHYEWSFGDSTTSTLKNPVHTFPSSHPWYIVHYIFDTLNNIVCGSYDSIYLVPPYGCGRISITRVFNDTMEFCTTQLSGAHIEWNFDDGSPIVTGNPVLHKYAQLGWYNCTETQKDSSGNIMCQYTTPINYYTTAGCYINAQVSSLNPFDIYFNAMSPIGNIINWNFGDNTTGTGLTTHHVYAAPGIYTVGYVSNDTTGDSCSTIQVVQVGTAGSNCTIITQPDSLLPTTVTFSDISGASSVHWDFGDNSTDSGTTVTHVFTTTGLYNVCMTISDSAAGMYCQHCDSVNVGVINCTFQATPSASVSLGFDFSRGLVNYQISWDFGDGVTGMGSTTSHAYASPGGYQVCMSEIDSTSGDTVCASCQWLNVAYPAICQASFLYTTPGLTMYFVDQSMFDPTASYLWYFGDGDSATVRNPQHTFATSGIYNVCLYHNSATCSASYCDSVYVNIGGNPVCHSLFAIVQTAPYQISIVNMSSGTSISYNWDFGDGNSDTAAYPMHFYNTTGTYNLCLTVSDSSGCNNTFCHALNVDSLGNVFRYAQTGFNIVVVSPSQLTGINDNITSKPLNIYPNPFGTELNISSGENDKIVSYTVYSIQGKLISTGKIKNVQGKLETTNYAPGTYLLEVKLEDGSRNYRRVIKK